MTGKSRSKLLGLKNPDSNHFFTSTHEKKKKHLMNFYNPIFNNKANSNRPKNLKSNQTRKTSQF